MEGSAETLLIAYRRLYPSFLRAGRQRRSPSTVSLGSPVSRKLVPWRPWTWVGARQELDRFRPDVLVVQWWNPLFGPCVRFLAKRARRSGSRVVIVCHNYRPHELVPFWSFLTRRALSSADVLVALSTPVAEQLRATVPHARVRVLPHPPNLPAVASGEGAAAWRSRLGPLHGPVVLFFGNVRPYKGLSDLVDAIALVRREVPATLVIAGTFFESLERFTEQIRTLGIEEAIRVFPDYVRDEEVGTLFELADVVALPYRSASQSGVVSQAALARRPVVATSVGGLPEGLGGQGIIVPPQDPPALADGLVRALRDPPPPPAFPEAGWTMWRDALLREADRDGRPRPGRPRPGRRRWPRRALALALWAAVGVFVGRTAWQWSGDVGATELHLSIPLLIAALLVGTAARLVDTLAWHTLMRGAGADLTVLTSARILGTAELVRFVPGGVLHMAARYRFSCRAGASREAVLTAMSFDLGLRLLAALVLFVCSLPFWPSAPQDALWFGILAILPIAVLLHPRMLHRLITRLARRKGGPGSEVFRPSGKPLIASGALVMIASCLTGTAVYLVAAALVSAPAGYLVPVAGVAAFSWMAGVLTPYAPGGLGAREAVGASLLSQLMPLPVAAVVMVASRLQSLVVEVGFTLAVVGLDARAGRAHRGHAPQSPGQPARGQVQGAPAGAIESTTAEAGPAPAAVR